jgi:predicted enzyme related to lactoylglutathione lyase
MRPKFVHTNLIAEDWRKLADFYMRAFGCIVVPPERDFAGEVLDAGTGLVNAHLRGVHLRLPGWGEDAPTLEIFSYDREAPRARFAVNQPGYGHIAFAVDNVSMAREEVIAQGGSPAGEIVTLTTSMGTRITWCYVKDPEGNVIELQAWAN